MHKFIINRIKQLAIGFVACAGLAVAVTSCSDDVYDVMHDPATPNPDGLYGPYSFTVSMSSSDSDERSRSTFATTGFEVNQAWMAMFDATSGRLIGMTKKEFEGVTPDPTHSNNLGSAYDMTFENLFFNDDNNQVFIVGVANYDGVMAYNNGLDVAEDENGLIPLETALDAVKTITDYNRIAVNTASAEAAVQGHNAPLMSGLFSTSGHQNATLNASGEPNNKSAAYFELFDATTKKLKNGITGMVHLRRLVTHLNVEITIGNGINIENPTIEIYNIPRSVFLQEHTTVQNPETHNATTWKNTYTTAASDAFGGYYNDLSPIVVNGNAIVDIENAGFFQDESDRMKISGNKITFGYWHYENKHWGLANSTNYKKREERYENSNVFKSLCQSQSDDYNNGATYMVIRGKVIDNVNGLTGNAEFYVHEGYSCNADGTQATDLAVASRDFSTFRNTNYTYDIRINGINDMVLNVTSDNTSAGNPGLSGDVWDANAVKSMQVDRTGNSYDIFVSSGILYWCIEEDGVMYGVPMDNDYIYKDRYAQYPVFTDPGNIADSKLYNHITIDGESLPIAQSRAFDVEGKHVLTFDSNTDAQGTLYLCAGGISPDGHTRLYTLYKFVQDGLNSDVIRFDAGNIIWHNNWYEYSTANVWVGCPNSIINVLWYHDSRILGYDIDVYDLDGNVKMKSFHIADATPYLQTFNGKTIFKYPLNTIGLPAGGTAATSGAVNYSFDITPIVDETRYESGGATQIRGDKTERTIRICPSNWEIGAKKEWDVAVSNVLQPGLANEIYLRGLRYYQSSKTDGSGSKVDDKDGYFILPGGGGSLTNRCFSFYAASSGKVTAKISNNGGSTTDTKIVHAYKMNPDGSATEIYNSEGTTMGKAGTQTSYTFNVTIDSDPQEIRIYTTGGGVRYYSIAYTPN